VHHELLGDAARDARRRAEAYVQALDLSLGSVELISETPITATPPGGEPPHMLRAMKASGGAADMAVSGGQIELVADVHVRFAVL
jgi:uncharacterized protein YggE